MPYITARFPDELIADLDRTANELRRARSDVVREAVERYLESLKEVRLALERTERAERGEDRVVDIDIIKRHLVG
ncbi:MAG: ribbon-helix-helix protein, CopG family [Gammaproteobacteria bacterium]|jgi:predicted DNA-binding protein|nr:ribbon-helix-helix protein, CopG family [Gammaproteobacteria bacterium]